MRFATISLLAGGVIAFLNLARKSIAEQRYNKAAVVFCASPCGGTHLTSKNPFLY
jgi:hypothetical protein